LKDFKSKQSKRSSHKYGFDNAPEDKYRLYDEEPPTMNQISSKPQIVKIDQKPDDFEFTNRGSLQVGADDMGFDGDEPLNDPNMDVDNLKHHLTNMDF